MTLLEFKNHIARFPNGHVFDYGISRPFSWRGSYDEVAFSITKRETTKEEILMHINTAIGGTFEGWKGGDYQYNESTPVNFESEPRSYSDGSYTSEMIAEIKGEIAFLSQEHRLACIAFC